MKPRVGAKSKVIEHGVAARPNALGFGVAARPKLGLGQAVRLRMYLGTRCKPRSQKIQKIFFLLKFNMVCMFWIVLMCWYQKWFLKNKKTSLACISAQKVIWKATATTLPSTL